MSGIGPDDITNPEHRQCTLVNKFTSKWYEFEETQ